MVKQKRRTKRTSTSRKIARQEASKAIKRQIETKSYTGFSLNSNAPDYSGTFWSMYTNPFAGTSITRGTGEFNYVGGKIKPIRISMKYNIVNADNTNMVRITVIQMRGASTITSASDVYTSVLSIHAPLSPISVQYNDTYNVLYDRLFNTDTTKVSLSGSINIPGKKLKRTSFDSNGLVESGDIYVFMISDSALVVNPTVLLSHRIYFKDA